MMRSLRAAILLSLGLSLLDSAGADDILITELMAVNDAAIRDEDGDTPDFVELFNAGVTACDLGGWHLTDDVLNMTKWRFPAVTLQPGEFLVVFCSDKNRRDPERQLHTNFKLASSGEYLALVEPDGSTVRQEFAPFPLQVAGFSFGLSQNATELRFVDASAPCRAFVPPDDGLGTSWRQVDFDDSGWPSGTTGVGYDRNNNYLPLIGLDVFDEMEGSRTTCYIRVPFQVEDPSAVGNLLLKMKYDDGFVAFINGVEVARANAPAGIPGLTWDSNAPSDHPDGEAETFLEFPINGVAGVLEQGDNVLAIHGLNRNLSSSDFLQVPELTGFNSGDLDRDTLLFFPDPSPGSGNLPGVTGIAPPPTVTPASGVISQSTQVTIETDSETGTIHYSTDGSNPTQRSTRYTGPFSVSSSAWIRARVYEPDDSVSPTVSTNYIFIASNVRNFASTIPVVVIDNYGQGRPGGNTYRAAFMAIYEPVNGRTSFSEPPTLAHRLGMKTRGSSTGGRDKASYTIEFWDEKNEDDDVRPLGLPEESDWVLYGAYNFDRLHMRNPLMFELSRQCGRYATLTRFCEVYFNMGGGALDQGDYRGIYSFMEKIKRGEDRVDIDALLPEHDSEPEISGGYMLKIDRADPGDGGFSGGGIGVKYVDPKERDIPSYQATWIRNYLDDFASALNGGNFRHPTLGYAPYVNSESWVDHHLLNVLSKNADALRLSTYFYKDRDKKIEYGPIWDFDRSIDSTDGRDNDPLGWNGGTNYFNYPWWGRLFDDPDFMQLYRDRWHRFRTDPESNATEGLVRPPLSNSNINSIMDGYREVLRDAQPRDTARWNQISFSGWLSEVNRIKSWLNTRANWMDTQFRAPPRFSPLPREIDPGARVTMTATTGTIYYTLDGSDPREPGGGIAGSATRYRGAVTLDDTALVTARARVSTMDWSPPTRGTYYTEAPPLVISELMYHPEPPDVGSDHVDEDFEFVEITNVSGSSYPLAGVSLGGAVRFTFPAVGNPRLGPGEYVVVVSNLQAFAERYDVARIFVAGEYEGRFENQGERVILRGALGEPIHDFTYSDTWYSTTDGGGDSLVVVDLLAERDQWNSADNWGPSSGLGGSPGGSDEGFPTLGGRQRIGDGNQDGRVDISDAYSIVRHLFLGDPGPLPCDGDGLDGVGNLQLLDVDGSGGVDVTDAIGLLEYLYRSGPPPQAGTDCVRLEGCPNLCLP